MGARDRSLADLALTSSANSLHCFVSFGDKDPKVYKIHIFGSRVFDLNSGGLPLRSDVTKSPLQSFVVSQI